MNARDENYVSMCRAVNDVFTRYSADWQPSKRFEQEVTAFRNYLQSIMDTKTDSSIVTTGATVDKADAAMQLFTQAVDLGKRASIYALDNNNQELHDRLRISRGALLQMRDTLALAKCKDIYNQLDGVKSHLADYGIAEADLAELKRLTDAYDVLISRPRGLIVERKGHNETIPELIRHLRESIYKLDSLINLFSGTAFETDYKNARIIVDLVGQRKKKAENEPPAETE